MPYEARKSDACPSSRPWGVFRVGDSDPRGCHSTEDDAKAQMAALYSIEKRGDPMTATLEPRSITRQFRDLLRSMVRKQQDHAGVIIGLFLPPDVAAQIAVPGGEAAADLHLTLKFLAADGQAVPAQVVEGWATRVAELAEHRGILVGRITGVGRFNGDAADGQAVTYATVDLAGLADLAREAAWCDTYPPASGWVGGVRIGPDGQVIEEHDFAPHITLAYGDVELPEVPTIPLRIDRLTLAVGAERRDYLFAGADTADPLAKAAWSTAFINDLPDSDFAYVAPGGKKDDEGKTTPRSLRHLPYKDHGKLDAAHVRNGLARVDQADIPEAAKASARKKLESALAQLNKADEQRAETVAKAIAGMGISGAVEIAPLRSVLDGRLWMVRADGLPYAAALERDDSIEVRAVAKASDVERAFDPPTVGRYAVVKADAERKYTLGVAYPASALRKPSKDAHGDFATADELEGAAWDYMRRLRKATDEGLPGIQHAEGSGGAGEPVESYIYRGPRWKVADQVVEPGDWMLGVIWSDDAWQLIKSGKLTGYSIQGTALRAR